MSIYGTFLIEPKREVVSEVSNQLQIQVSKLSSRRLHLQSLIAKRDRLDYEIKELKKRIREDKKAKTRTGKPVKEQAISLLESQQQSENVFHSGLFTEEITEIRVLLNQLKDEENLIEILETLPRLES